MCSKNRIGPKTVPCGTPESTVTRSDCIPSTTTRCFRKLEINSGANYVSHIRSYLEHYSFQNITPAN